MTELQELQLNRKRLCRLFDKVGAVRNERQKVTMAMHIAEFACSTGHGIWSSPVLERVFIDAAQKIVAPVGSSYNPSTCLFVSTMLLQYGGLERVMERWVETDPAWKYSLVLTKQERTEVPRRIAKAIDASGGEVLDLAASDEYAKAAALRTMASNYECIVLMAYEEDPVPLLAFGTTDFARPVGLYNQCDHHFWMNVGVADLVGDLRIWGQNISLRNRGVRDSMIVPVPSEVRSITKLPKAIARKRLGLLAGKKIVLSVARHMKFHSIAGMSFLDLAIPLLEADSDIIILLIGPTVDTVPEFKPVCRRFGERFRLEGYVPHDKLYDYYFAADLVLDSYPTGGITASEDAIACGCPLVSRSSTIDFISESKAYCKTDEDLIAYSLKLLASSEERQENVKSAMKGIERFSSPPVFIEKRDAFMASLRQKKHVVKDFHSQPTDYIKEDYLMLSLGHGFFRRTNLTAWALDIFPSSVGCLCVRVFDSIRNLRKRINKKLRRQR